MNKWIQLSIIAILSVIVLGACGNNETGNENKEEANESENTYTIGVTQLLEHPSLDNAYEGFQEAIEEAGLDVEYDYQNAQNDQNNVKPIADNFVRSEEHTSELQSRGHLVCRLLLEKKKKTTKIHNM